MVGWLVVLNVPSTARFKSLQNKYTASHSSKTITFRLRTVFRTIQYKLLHNQKKPVFLIIEANPH